MTQQAAAAADPDQIRAELTEWVQQHWDPGMALRDWRELLLQAGWAVPSWPRDGTAVICRPGLMSWSPASCSGSAPSACRSAAAPGWPRRPYSRTAPTNCASGLLEPILTGEQTWCQLFSEPGAGSDLAGLSTSAVLDGDSWVINGQKVWNTSAHHADMGMLLARTDASVPKHQGITYFALPMQQPGVEVRQLRQMNFHASFNEVFLTDARIPRDNVIGTVGGGWTAALTTLAYERRFSALRRPDYSPAPGRALEEARAEADDHFATYSWYPQRAGRPDLVVEHARAAGVSDDPVIRQAIARLITMHRASVWTAERARAARAPVHVPARRGRSASLRRATSRASRRRCTP